MPGWRLRWLDGKGQGKHIAGEEIAPGMKLLTSLCGNALADGPDFVLWQGVSSVSYTHLTLPTKRIV